ncbi:YdcF family protein, partial [Nocardia farcinica]|uniref:YdcF family protein n=1 Tax=Nocardia farcinica TaxID=37329 RepID=UPI003D78DAF7
MFSPAPRAQPASTHESGLRRGFGPGLARWIRRGVAGAILITLIVVGGTAVRVWQVARIDDYSPADAIVVLGAAQYSGTPSSVFEARLDRAYRLFRAGVAPRVITVGGKQEGDLYTEAASGKIYLEGRGLPGEARQARGTRAGPPRPGGTRAPPQPAPR